MSSCLGDPLSILADKIGMMLISFLLFFILFFEDEDNIVDICGKLAEGLAGRWAHFGLQLGLTHQAIQDIHAQLADTLESVNQVLLAGCEGKTMSKAQITWQKLAIAVDAPSGGNNPLLAKEIADNHRGSDRL